MLIVWKYYEVCKQDVNKVHFAKRANTADKTITVCIARNIG